MAGNREARLAYQREWNQRPDVKARARARLEANLKDPDYQSRQREYNKKYRESERGKQTAAAYREREYVKEERRAANRRRSQREDVKAKIREYGRSERAVAYRKEYYRRPEVREKENRRLNARYHRMGGHGFSRHKFALWVSQRGLCAICGGIVWLTAKGRNHPSVDHIRPQDSYPEGTPPAIINCHENLQLVHMRCNSAKGTKWEV